MVRSRLRRRASGEHAGSQPTEPAGRRARGRGRRCRHRRRHPRTGSPRARPRAARRGSPPPARWPRAHEARHRPASERSAGSRRCRGWRPRDVARQGLDVEHDAALGEPEQQHGVGSMAGSFAQRRRDAGEGHGQLREGEVDTVDATGLEQSQHGERRVGRRSRKRAEAGDEDARSSSRRRNDIIHRYAADLPTCAASTGRRRRVRRAALQPERGWRR